MEAVSTHGYRKLFTILGRNALSEHGAGPDQNLVRAIGVGGAYAEQQAKNTCGVRSSRAPDHGRMLDDPQPASKLLGVLGECLW
jgi:hypothetical protein